MPSILLPVKPLSGVGCIWQRAVKIFDVDTTARIDRQTRSAFLVLTELEFAWPDVLAQTGFGILIGVERQVIT